MIIWKLILLLININFSLNELLIEIFIFETKFTKYIKNYFFINFC